MHVRSTPELRARTAQWLRISGADLASRTSTACDKCFGGCDKCFKDIPDSRWGNWIATGNSVNVTIKQETTVPARPRGPLPPHWHGHWGVLWAFQRSCPAKLQHSLNPVCTDWNEWNSTRWSVSHPFENYACLFGASPIISLKIGIKTKHTCEQYQHLMNFHEGGGNRRKNIHSCMWSMRSTDTNSPWTLAVGTSPRDWASFKSPKFSVLRLRQDDLQMKSFAKVAIASNPTTLSCHEIKVDQRCSCLVDVLHVRQSFIILSYMSTFIHLGSHEQYLQNSTNGGINLLNSLQGTPPGPKGSIFIKQKVLKVTSKPTFSSSGSCAKLICGILWNLHFEIAMLSPRGAMFLSCGSKRFNTKPKTGGSQMDWHDIIILI